MTIHGDISKRIGKFKVNKTVFFQDYDLMKRVFNDAVVVECIHHWNDVMEYVCISPLFEEVEEGCIINDYEVVISENEVHYKHIRSIDE